MLKSACHQVNPVLISAVKCIGANICMKFVLGTSGSIELTRNGTRVTSLITDLRYDYSHPTFTAWVTIIYVGRQLV